MQDELNFILHLKEETEKFYDLSVDENKRNKRSTYKKFYDWMLIKIKEMNEAIIAMFVIKRGQNCKIRRKNRNMNV